jgi:ABC-type multidrug transport system ATPase subunit
MRRERILSVELKDVTHAFENSAPLLEDLSLNIPLGEAMVLEGAPGSGKSILLKILAGITAPTSGKVLYNGRSVEDMTYDEFTPIRLSTSFCFEEGGLLMNKSLRENIEFGLMYHRGWRKERSQLLFEELVAHFEIGPFLNLRPASLSASVRKLGGLVRSFLHNAQILYLDEPSLGIGEKGLAALNYWIEKHRREGKHDEVIVIASSDDKFIKQHGMTHLKLHGGKLIDPGRTLRDAG